MNSPFQPPDPTPPRSDLLPESFERRFADPPQRQPAADVPPDFRVPWGWFDAFLFLIFFVGSAILILAIIDLIAAPIMHRAFIDLLGDKTLQAYFGIVAQAISSGLSLVYLAILVSSRRGGPFWSAIGWRPMERAGFRPSPAPLVLTGIALAVVGGLLDQFLPPSKPVPMQEMLQTRLAVIMLCTFGICVAPLIEETVFRGFLYPLIGRSFGVPVAIVTTGILFGAMHLGQLWGAWIQVGVITCVGIILTWVRAKRGTVLASFLIHISYNSTLFLAVIISTSGLRHMPTR